MLRQAWIVGVAAALAACGSDPVTMNNTGADSGAAETGAVADGGDTDAAAIDGGQTADAGVEDPDVVVTFHPDASSPMTAIEAPAQTWTWVDFPDSACGNGAPTGIAVNLNPSSRRVFIFLQGGGGCWDGLLCYGVGSAANLRTGYNATQFSAERGSISSAPFFNRNNMQNPWRDANLVYVPYCTGDIHGGDRITTYRWGAGVYPTYHVGARNIDAFLRRLAPTFASPERVTIMGASAGGFGVGINWERFANAWPGVRVDMIDDSGPPVQPPADRWATIRNAWNLQFPAGCTQCSERLDALLEYYATRFPAPTRMALLSYINDTTIPTYFGQTPQQFGMALEGLAGSQITPHANMRYYFVNASGHVLGFNFNNQAMGGPTVGEWLNQMDSDDPMWANVPGR